ncbi:MAG: hypothetical protein ACI90V_011760 [Bacillariaceae sp.]|jgi:hypothetical protein
MLTSSVQRIIRTRYSHGFLRYKKGESPIFFFFDINTIIRDNRKCEFYVVRYGEVLSNENARFFILCHDQNQIFTMISDL